MLSGCKLADGVDRDCFDLESILNMPNYIYFEEHHPTKNYLSLSNQREALRTKTQNQNILKEVSIFDVEKIEKSRLSKRPKQLRD